MKRAKAVFFGFAAFLLCAPGLSWAQVRTDIQTILSDPNAFDGRKVEVEGKVESVRSRISGKGNPYTVFRLAGDGESVSVYTMGDQPLKEGDLVVVTGRFQKIKYISQYEFKNEIDATDGKVEKAIDAAGEGAGEG